MRNSDDVLDNVLGITDVVETTTREVTPPKPVLVPTTTGTDEDIDNDYKSKHHSHTVGTQLKEGYDIPHYSDLIFKELQEENENRDTAVQVIHKKDNV